MIVNGKEAQCPMCNRWFHAVGCSGVGSVAFLVDENGDVRVDQERDSAAKRLRVQRKKEAADLLARDLHCHVRKRP